jgi:hypothetical protein
VVAKEPGHVFSFRSSAKHRFHGPGVAGQEQAPRRWGAKTSALCVAAAREETPPRKNVRRSALRVDAALFPRFFGAILRENEDGAPISSKGVIRVASTKRKVVRVRFGSASARKPGRDDGKSLLLGIVKATRKPGINRSVVFRSGTSKKVYAYSVLPSDPSKIVREAEDGTRTIGQVRNGKFRASKTHKPR